MEKYILTAMLVMAVAVFAQDGDVPIPINPGGPGNSGPMVFLSGRTVDIGIDIDGSGKTINPTDYRPGNYAFTGEKIIYVVLVRDLNGVDDIVNVIWTHDGQPESLCNDVTNAVVVPGNGDALYCFEGNTGQVTEPICIDEECGCLDPDIEVEIDTSTNLNWDNQTDALYQCVLEVESQWDGSPIAVVAEDNAGQQGQTLEEDWNFNPPLIVDIDTSDGEAIGFGPIILDQNAPGATSPNCVTVPSSGVREDQTYRNCALYVDPAAAEKLCDVSFSTNKLIVKNIGEVNLWAFIASENFYATQNVSLCPFTNELHANQLEYRATSGSYDSGWRMMPQYSPNLQCMGIGIGDSTNPPFNLGGQCRGGCRIPAGGPPGVAPGFGGDETNPELPGLDILSPTHTIEVALKLVWPTPCIGTFDEGDIHVLIRAV